MQFIISWELSQVIPYYQAIISADTHSIYGYEVLGRIKEGNKVKSLGAFFHHSEISDEAKLAVDIHSLKNDKCS